MILFDDWRRVLHGTITALTLCSAGPAQAQLSNTAAPIVIEVETMSSWRER